MQSLTFNGIALSPVSRHNAIWIRATELARALGYSDGSIVSRLYRKHSDEFSAEMTQVIEMPAEDRNGLLGSGRCRIFSLRGCHLLAMFARTPVAKDFRKWVLDVLDKYNAEHQAALPPEDAPITPADQSVLQTIVREKIESIPAAQRGKGLYPQIWSRFNNHFRLGSYKQLPQCRMADAVMYLMRMDVRAKALPPATDDERYLRFLEQLEERRKLISKNVGELAYEALTLLPMQRIAEQEQVANVCGLLSRWIAEEITSPLPRGRGGLERRDKDSPLWMMMTL